MKINILILICILLTTMFCLHLKTSEQQMKQRLDVLIKQQKQIQDKVQQIIKDTDQIQKDIKSKTNNTQKLEILEKAIIQQRLKTNKITQIIGSNQQKIICNQLTEQQKKIMKKQISNYQLNIQKFKSITNYIAPCDRLKQIQTDIQKQANFAKKLDNILNQQCKLTNKKIYQTYFNAKGWILGEQTLLKVKNQYVQRAEKFDNVANCPAQTPFYNGQQCMNCPISNPVFNIFTKKCQNCPQDYQVNNELKQCIKKKYYSLLDSVDNYFMNTSKSKPLPENGSYPCPKELPFYNSLKCIQCLLPKYWNVDLGKCEQCPLGQSFSINLKKCTIRINNKLTKLQDTQWIINDGNISRIYQQRASKLKSNNKTNFTQCQNTSPFFDGVTCIFCPNQFNIDTNKCSSPPQNKLFNSNTKQYALIEKNKQNNPLAKGYISKTALKDTQLQNCDINKPFFDGISCIGCQKPFPLFNTESKKCMDCPINSIYKQKTHQCAQYKYLSNPKAKNFLESGSQTYQKLIKQQNQLLKQQQYKICPQQTPYSIGKSCINCTKQKQHFNLSSKSCVDCPGQESYLSEVRQCSKIIFLINLSANNILEIGNDTIEKIMKQQDQIKKKEVVSVCPLSSPYVINNSCIKCNLDNPLFNLNTKICVKCQKDQKYIQGQHKCIKNSKDHHKITIIQSIEK